MKKTFKQMMIFTLTLFMVLGCSKSPTDKQTNENKKILYVQTDTELSTMDHAIATDGNSFIMQQAMISGLMRLDENNAPVCELASKYEISEDGKVYTFHIRDNANWSNETPVTAEDFVFGWRRLVDPKTASEYGFIADTAKIKNAAAVNAGTLPLSDLGVEAIDSKTLVVTLDGPVDFFLSLMAFPSFYPLNEAFYTSLGDQYSLKPENLLACGPYIMTKWISGNSYTFDKNPKYWDAENIKLDGVVFKFIQDIQSAMLEFDAGKLDQVKLSGELVDLYSTRPEFNNRLQGYLWYLSINQTIDTFQNKDLRQALSFAIDRDKLVKYVLKDGSIAARGIVPVALSTGPDGKDYRETTSDFVSYDPIKANTYFDAAKKALGDKISFELLYEDSEASKAVAEYLAAELETTLPGLSVNLKSQPKKARLELLRTQDFEIGLTRWGPDYADPQTYLDLFISTNLSNNSGRYNSKKYDADVLEATKGESAADSNKRWELLKQGEKTLVLDDMAIVPVYQNGGAMMISSNVKGIEFHAVGVDSYRNVTKE